MNEEIRYSKVLLIGADGHQYGEISSREANQIALEKGFDLVLVAPNAKPPVCKLMDYSKYRYEQQKKAKEARRHQKTVELKEIRMTAVIEEHDLNTKLNHAQKFLTKGNKVKATVRLPYRAGDALVEQGKEVLNHFYQALSEYGDMDGNIDKNGRFLAIMINPKN
ncbi:translation initiation factor IF-3 [Hujiaoplasma nucleasis]|uniref:Translation initiation factor IF-3 n=1 Tax=Hujiaoplasma nucleasis TaxID=2725268 RepID=A0A7L6N5X9_9MOLU|nr:translation initiation factor IF-3 [Hujiaoplasma nucleasis]